MASNYEPFESNTRRYNLVEYLQKNIVETLTDEERNKYFPLWNNEKRGVELIVEAFEVCPFKSEHKDWNSLKTANESDVGTRYYNTLILIQEAVEKFDENQFTSFSPLSKMRPTEFARVLSNMFGGRTQDYTSQLSVFLTEMRSKGLLRENQCEGKTPIVKKFYDWKKVANDFSCGEDSGDGQTPLESTASEWNALIQAELQGQL
jgi:hypothetical protein